MVVNGKTTAAAAKLSKSVPLPTTLSYPHSASLDYYMDEVKNVLLTDDPTVQGDPAEALGSTQQVRSTALYRGGLKIYTVYDPTLQFEATAAMNAELPQNTQFTASLVVIDNADGGVRAIANGRTFAQMQFDPATEGPGRQAGSSFKTFTLAAALSRGYSANDTVSTTPLHWRLDQGSGESSFYNLGGSGDDCGGDTISLTRAIARSDNCAFVRTELSLGPGHFGADGVGAVTQMAKAMGINTSNFNPSVVSTTLGTQGVHPLDMAQAYSVLPNEGILKRATFITKIVDRNGRTIYQAPTTGTRVLDQNVARTETKMLTGVLRSGTAASSLGRFPSGRGQDGHHRPQPGRLVRRLHAAVHGRGLDGEPAGRGSDDQRQRHPGVRRHLPGHDLAALHGGRDESAAGRPVRGPRRHAVQPFAVHHRARAQDHLCAGVEQLHHHDPPGRSAAYDAHAADEARSEADRPPYDSPHPETDTDHRAGQEIRERAVT